jgi:L-lactate dehydrogenase complex protein LldG
MSDREGILARVRANRPTGTHPLPELPRFALQQPDGLVPAFQSALLAMGGNWLGPMDTRAAQTVIAEKFPTAKVVCSAVPEVAGNRHLDRVSAPRELADVDVAVARAVLGVAESGSVLFTEAELRVNTLAYLAQHLVVLLSRSAIVPGLQDAYDHPCFLTARYAVFHTGPSASGDIEGVLVHPAQGVRSLTVILD